jgi:Zn-dependent peptidase ImmA (M78 family)
VQANLGMASLLMPADVFKEVVRAVVGDNRCGGAMPSVPSPESVAFRELVIELSRRCCGVSQQAARIRLETLGLVSDEAGPMLGGLPD